MRACTIVVLLVTLMLGSLSPESSAARRADDIMLDMVVNYGSAYRDGSWVPVDVLVVNDDFHISGWVEVRTFSAMGEQSPRYRVPAECPKGSRKRFRLVCRLEGTTRIEVMLYHRNRPVLEIPQYLNVQPIAPEDYLSLVLDDKPEDFGFLYRSRRPPRPVRRSPWATFAARLADRPADPASPGRFHRESLRTEQLSTLADHPQCYDSFDVIVMGDIEPDRIGLRHRALLIEYVEEGGVLVVCTGNNAPAYRGSWVEELLGIRIGAEEIMTEGELGRAVFPPEELNGLDEQRECVVARLAPRSADIKTFGRGVCLATLRPVGQGYVAALAVDAATDALQDCEGYLELWGELCSLRHQRGTLNFAAAAQYCSQVLPSMSGVEVQPKSSVLMYLALYFLVAIVANWLVCNWLRRRELAWFLLIIFSIGFTGYAMVFGTAGRAKSSELEQIEVLHVPLAGNSADLHSIVGILTARSSRYSMNLAHQNALASDITSMPWLGRMGYRGGRGAIDTRPFHFVQSDPPRIERLTIGASEMRIILVEAEVPIRGGIDGTLMLDENGLSGTLTNNTGFRFINPFLLIDGRLHAITGGPDEWTISLPLGSAQGRDDSSRPPWRGSDFQTSFLVQLFNVTWDASRPAMAVVMAGGGPPPMMRERTMVPGQALVMPPSGQMSSDQRVGPYLCGWVNRQTVGSVELDARVRANIKHTLLVADIDVQRKVKAPDVLRPLVVNLSGVGSWLDDLGLRLQNNPNVEPMVEISCPRPDVGGSYGDVLVDLWWERYDNLVCTFAPLNVDPHWSKRHMVNETTERINGRLLARTTYRIDDWRSYCDNAGRLIGRICAQDTHGMATGSLLFNLYARIVEKVESHKNGDLARWQ